MLRVTVELIPFGNEEYKKTIGQVNIINRGDHNYSPDYGNYTYTLDANDHLYDGRVDDHFRSKGWAPLLLRILKQVVDKEE